MARTKGATAKKVTKRKYTKRASEGSKFDLKKFKTINKLFKSMGVNAYVMTFNDGSTLQAGISQS